MFPRMVALTTMVIALFAASVATSEDPPKDEQKEYAGMVVSAGDEKLTIKVGEEEFTFSVTDETSLKFEDEDAELEDLKEGHFAKVTATKADDKFTATAIDARMAQ